MTIRKHFVLQEIAGEYIVVPIAEEADRLNGIITLTETGAFLWGVLSEKDVDVNTLVEALVSEYHIDLDIAKSDIYDFLGKIKALGCLE